MQIGFKKRNQTYEDNSNNIIHCVLHRKLYGSEEKKKHIPILHHKYFRLPPLLVVAIKTMTKYTSFSDDFCIIFYNQTKHWDALFRFFSFSFFFRMRNATLRRIENTTHLCV